MNRLPVVFLLALVTFGCARTGRDPARDTAATGAPSPAPPGSSGASIYELGLSLTDADGSVVALSDLRDTVRVAAMIYTNCSSVCPRITHDMKGVEALLPATEGPEVGFVLFSLDPLRDSSAALRGFARDHGLDPVRWRLFSAPEDGVRDLAAVLGVKYRAEAKGEFAHSAMIFVLDRDGVIRHRQVGLDADPRELVAAVEAARSPAP